MENVILTNMCMVYDGDQVLVQERVKNWKGITFPGGHVNLGESIVESTKREIREETGLIIDDLVMCGIKNWYDYDKEYRYIVFLFKTDNFKGELKASEEGDVFWTNLSEINNYQLSHDFEYMVEVFTKENLTEHYYYQENDEWKFKLM